VCDVGITGLEVVVAAAAASARRAIAFRQVPDLASARIEV